ncbi:hypothetical protein [Streptomyces sp. MK5]|uniref:hypothetical protein n=1 Tax=Streptomyces sp. MK5 TaxID=3064253 RepID=UPI002740B318|nr:hypothetical protein [Streptomyces sp. MK5]
MDVISRALRAAAARPHVLMATLPGGTAARLEAERLLRMWDWPPAATPAQADLLLGVGPGRPEMQAALDRLWQDLPLPRARVHAPRARDVEAALEAGRARLGSPSRQREQVRTSTEKGRHGSHSPHGGHGGKTREGEGGRGGHEDHGSDGGEHGGHGGPGAGETETPGGLPMAEQGEDRDGLTLDRLHVPLGPFLNDWPAGLTIRLVLQGDVIQQADLEDARPPTGGKAVPFWVQPWLRAAAGERVSVGEAARRRAAAHLDSLARLLSVAGWPTEAVAARRLRDDLLTGAAGSEVAARLERLARRVGRSRTLAWLTHGIGRVSAEEAREAGVSGPAARAGGDVTDRYRQWLADIRRDVARLDDSSLLRSRAEETPRGHWKADGPPSAALLTLLPRLLTGAELAAARLIVASLDPDLDELAVTRPEVTVGG